MAALVCGVPVPAVFAESTQINSGIVISELQTAGATDATEEFVELYNTSEESVNVTGWLLQYRSASGTASQTWPSSSTKATLRCETGSPSDCQLLINPHERLVLVHTIANIAGAVPMSGGFSSSGGQIRLVQPGATIVVHDFVGYGTAADFETAAAVAPSAGKSLKRAVSAQGAMQDTQNNSADFIADCGSVSPGQTDTDPLPLASGCAAAPDDPGEPEQPTDEPLPDDDPDPTPTYLPLYLTEIFPDPEAPAQDATDEFIELYNPHDATISLAGYQLQAGSGFRYHYTLGAIPLGPHRYLVIPSAVSHVSLANSGSGVRLLDPLGVVVAEVADYGTAKAGQSWALFEGRWQWTLSPTPGTDNILSLPPPPAKTTQKVVKKKASTAKAPTAPKATKAPVPKSPQPVPTEVVATAAKIEEPPYWIIVPLALSIIGYGIYEYRSAIAKMWRTCKKRLAKKTPETDQELD